jgi:predicted transcriptional regulator of viral defense system
MSVLKQVRPAGFFELHPVFRREEFAAVHSGDGSRSPQTTATVLKQYVASGKLVHVRRGVYATVPSGVSAQRVHVDPYLLATKLSPDAVVSHHAALQFHGRAYSLWNRFHYLTRNRQQRFAFRGLEFVPVQVPVPLRAHPDLGGGIVEHRHAGGLARVASLERTLVDVLDAPERSGGWEEVWRSLEMVEFFDVDAVLDYTRALGSALTAARVGFFLEEHGEALMLEERQLEPLRELAPVQPRYLDSRRERGKLLSGWNLIVPERVLSRAWEEAL